MANNSSFDTRLLHLLLPLGFEKAEAVMAVLACSEANCTIELIDYIEADDDIEKEEILVGLYGSDDGEVNGHIPDKDDNQ